MYVIERHRQEEDVNELCSRFEYLVSERRRWDSLFQEIRDTCYPNAEDFFGSETKGQLRDPNAYDSTPNLALQNLASGYQSFMMNPFDIWFSSVTDNEDYNLDFDVIAWLERVDKQIYNVMRHPLAQYSLSMHEMTMDACAFGTGVIYSYWEPKNRMVQFKSFPLAHCYIDENDQGFVDTVFRKMKMTKRQAVQYFGEDRLPEKIRECKNISKEFEFVHAVFPRSDYKGKSPFAVDKKFASVWFCTSPKKVIEISGFDRFPYQIHRWEKRTGECYGISPAMNCLYDIRYLNAAKAVMMKSSQLQAAPPIAYEDENVLSKIKLAPYEMIKIAEGAQDPIRPIAIGGNLAVNERIIEGLKEDIKRGMFNDIFQLPDFGGRDRVTREEVMASKDDNLRRMTSIYARAITEVFQPQITGIYEELLDHSTPMNPIIPNFPMRMNGRKMDIVFTSAAAMAQRSAKTANIQRFMGDLVAFGQANPQAFDIMDSDSALQDIAIDRGVSRRHIRRPEEIAQMRQAKQQQAQMMQMMEQAPNMAGALKDLGDAGEKLPVIGQAFGL